MVGFVFMLIQNFSYMKIPKYIQVILDEISGQNRGTVIRTNILYIFIFSAVMAISLFLMRKLIISVSRKIEYQLRKKIFHKLLSMDYFFFQRNETGDLISRCTNDLNHVRTLLGPGVMYIPNSLSRLVLFLPVLIRLSGSLMLILGFIMLLVVIIIVVLLPLLRPHFLRIQEAMGTMNNRVWQVISGISTIKQYTAEGIEVERFKTLNEDYIQKQMAVVKRQEFLRPLFFFVFSITELVILWVGGRQVINGQMTIGQLLQFNIMISYLTFPVLALGWMMSLVQQGISAMGRINYILDQPVEDRERKKPLLADKLEFYVKNLTYQYPGFDRAVLKNISLTVMPGQTIGITGQVGSGKSTLLNVLTGLIKPDPGQVFVNGTDICEIDPESLSRKMAVVSQDPFLFSRTLAENIALGPDEMPMEAIRKAAGDAGLTKDIQSFHDGFSQEVGERGITLSGGQKQRIAIARALGKCAPLLVLDDPLSNIDARTETRILKNLQSLDCFQTLIVVSHRVSVLKTADVIYVLDDGTIIEQGTHRSLVRRKNGLYARLAKLQQMELELEE
jgi:ATP-binding cassette subfamily B protein